MLLDHNFRGKAGNAYTGEAGLNVTVGSAVYETAHYGVGIKCASGERVVIYQTFTGAPTRVFSRIIKISGAPSADLPIFQVRHASGQLGSIIILTTGRLRVSDGTGSPNTTSTVNVPVNTEFRLVVTHTAGSLTAVMYPDRTSTTPLATVTVTLSNSAQAVAASQGRLNESVTGCEVVISWPQDDVTDPGVRKFVYLTADKVTGIVPKTVNVEVHHEDLPAGTNAYTVDFGDGTVVGPQASPLFTHTYTSPGDREMTPTVDVT